MPKVILSSALAVAGGYALNGITNPFTGRWLDLGHLGGVVAVVWIVGITNGFNLLEVNPYYQAIIQGAIILTAVSADALSRRSS